MRARDLAIAYPSLASDAPAEEAAQLLAEEAVEGVFVHDGHGGLQGVVTDTTLLDFLLPRYLAEDRALVGVLGEDAAEALWQRLRGRTVGELLSAATKASVAEVDDDATLVEVAADLVRSGAALVAVRDPGGRLLGGITTSRLIRRLLGAR